MSEKVIWEGTPSQKLNLFSLSIKTRESLNIFVLVTFSSSLALEISVKSIFVKEKKFDENKNKIKKIFCLVSIDF